MFTGCTRAEAGRKSGVGEAGRLVWLGIGACHPVSARDQS